MDVRLDGKVAIVTGGGGGFGRPYSLALAEAGAAVAVVDHDAALAERVVAKIRAQGGEAAAYSTDVASALSVANMLTEVVQHFGGLDILVNIAGVSSKSLLQDLPEEDWDRVIDINLKGMWLCCKAAIPHLIARGGGRIINMASSRGLHGQPNGAHYASSKGGTIALTKSLAQELKQHRVTVNCLGPGATDTPMWEGNLTAEQAAHRRATEPLGQPDDLAPMVVFLASDWGYQVTGHMVVRDIFVPR
ncbi:MAG: SDR family NAD(P)-dependent oxidoreductase [Chloroflexota bacterium]